MTIYTVHARSGRVDERTLFVKEGFCWPGLILSLPWLLYRRLFVEAAFYWLAVMLAALLSAFDLGMVGSALSILAALILGFEGNEIRRAALARKGYAMVGLVEAASAGDAEIRFFEARGGIADPAPAHAAHAAPPPLPKRPGGGGVVGLFPEASR